MSRRDRIRARLPFICLMLVLAQTCFVSAGCVDGGSSSGTTADSDGQAALVLDQAIGEEAVTRYIESFRVGVQCEDAASWAAYLADGGITPAELRTTTIYELAAPMIIRAKAAELGISADEEAIDARVEAMRSSLLVEDDASWQDELERYGMTEEELRNSFADDNLKEQVFQQVVGDIEPSDEELGDYASRYLASTTTKKLACVYGTNAEAVQSALNAIVETPSVHDGVVALKENPDEAGVNYADVGWDLVAELTSGMKTAVATLEAGEIADAPLIEGGYSYVFYVEDAYTFPAEASDVNLDDSSLKQAVAELAKPTLAKEAGSVWLQDLIEQETTIYDMPEGLPYDVEPQATVTSNDDNAGASASAGANESGKDDK